MPFHTTKTKKIKRVMELGIIDSNDNRFGKLFDINCQNRAFTNPMNSSLLSSLEVPLL